MMPLAQVVIDAWFNFRLLRLWLILQFGTRLLDLSFFINLQTYSSQMLRLNDHQVKRVLKNILILIFKL